LQRPDVIEWFLKRMQQLGSISEEAAKAAFSNYETFMAYNYGFYNVFMHAAYWGVLGALFTVALFIKRKPI
jgi:DHA2 family multidrug resistance protein